MINTDMKLYNYYTLGDVDEYGQKTLSTAPEGQIKMSINSSNISIANDNIKYKEATYIGLTLAAVNDAYIIDFEGERLKVLYVLPKGRYKTVFLREYFE